MNSCYPVHKFEQQNELWCIKLKQIFNCICIVLVLAFGATYWNFIKELNMKLIQQKLHCQSLWHADTWWMGKVSNTLYRIWKMMKSTSLSTCNNGSMKNVISHTGIKKIWSIWVNKFNKVSIFLHYEAANDIKLHKTHFDEVE